MKRDLEVELQLDEIDIILEVVDRDHKTLPGAPGSREDNGLEKGHIR